jgi:hypothetical protein
MNLNKKVALITIHVGFNFGSVLQTIATCNVLKKMGLNPQVINYVPPQYTYNRYISESFENPQKFIRHIIGFPLFVTNNYIYSKYLSSHCDLSPKIKKSDIFSESCPKADFYITGSDQVWNSFYNEGIDTRYFWNGIVGKKIAYASSIGTEKLTDYEAYIFFKYLSKYKAISVREKSAVRLLSEIGIHATQVLDPTFMLDKEEWKIYASQKSVKQPYLLVYLPYNISDKDLIYKSIREIAVKKNLRVVTFSWNYFRDNYADQTIRYASPGDFLSLMFHADYVVTNSFHGTAFSINLNKRFSTFMPSSFQTRLLSILDLCNLKNRLIENDDIEGQINTQIDYENVNKILKTERQKTYEFLNSTLL